MNILFLSDNFPPEVNAPATRTFEHCKEWVRLGAKVTVLTTQPNFPHGRLYDGYKNRLLQREELDGIQVIRVWTYITANEGFIKRSLDYVSFAVMASLVGLFQKADVIVATSPQFFTTWAGCFLGLVKRRPWVFELRDLWPESIVSVGAMQKGRLYHLLERIEMFLYRRADMIVPNTPAFKDNLVRRGIDEKKIHVICNGANLEMFKVQMKDEALESSLGLYGKFVIGYIGTHGLAHSLEFIVESLSEIEDPDLHYLFIGDGAMKSKVVERAEQLGMKNITFLPPVSKDEVSRYLSLLDVAIVPLKKSETFKTVIPSKIFESCAMGIPVLLGVEGQAKELVMQYEAGLPFEPENKQSFIDAVKAIKSSPMVYERISEGGLRLAQAYDRKKLAKEMLEALKGMVIFRDAR